MKKLFISVPMKGRTDEAIKASMEKMHKAAEVMVGEELEVIPSCIEHEPPKRANGAVWYLGKSIQMLAEADYMACVTSPYEWNGCEIEYLTARRYEIPMIEMPIHLVAPDAYEALRLCKKDWEEEVPTCSAI
jgi:hypothetical protein